MDLVLYNRLLQCFVLVNRSLQKKSDSLVEITLPEGNSQIFASKYQTVLPNKEQLIELIEEK